MYPMSTRLLIFGSKLTEMVLPLYVVQVEQQAEGELQLPLSTRAPGHPVCSGGFSCGDP